MPKEGRNNNVRSDVGVGPFVRDLADWLVEFLYNRVGVFLVAGAALYVSVLSFQQSQGEGLRSLIYFLLPTAWGAFGLHSLYGKSAAWERFTTRALPALGIAAGVLVSAVLTVSAPVSTANLAFGCMEATFFMMWLSSAEDERAWGLALLLMLTVVSLTAAATA